MGNNFTKAPHDLQHIRANSALMKIMREQPGIEAWLNQTYTEKDIEIEIKNISLKKAHGNDGIPGEAYKATAMWAITPITKIANLIKDGRPIPENGEKER